MNDLAALILAGGHGAVLDALASVLLRVTSISEIPLADTAPRTITLARSVEGYEAAICTLSKDMGQSCTRIDWTAIQDGVKVWWWGGRRTCCWVKRTSLHVSTGL